MFMNRDLSKEHELLMHVHETGDDGADTRRQSFKKISDHPNESV